MARHEPTGRASAASLAVLLLALVGCGYRDASLDDKQRAFAPFRELTVGGERIAVFARHRCVLLLSGFDPRPVAFTPNGVSVALPAERAGHACSRGFAAVLTADGYLLTAAHCAREEPLFVCVDDGIEQRCLAARVVWRGADRDDDRATDLAILRIDAVGLPCFAWADLDARAPGQAAIAIGRSCTAGRLLDYQRSAPSGGVIVHDMPTQSGDSGGPVLTEGGALLGVVSTLGWSWSGHRGTAVRPDPGWVESMVEADRARAP